MKDEHKLALISYRMERSKESLEAAQILLDNNLLTSSMNRIYYSMFYAVHALLILHDVSFSKHAQVKGYFNREFINKGIFPVELGKLYNKIFEYRQKFDYVDLNIPDAKMVADHIQKAREFVHRLDEYLKQTIDEK